MRPLSFLFCCALCLPASGYAAAPAAAESLPLIEVRSGNRVCPAMPVSVLLTAPAGKRLSLSPKERYVLAALPVRASGPNRKQPIAEGSVACQVETEGKSARVTFLLPELKSGEVRSFRLTRVKDLPAAPGIAVTESGKDAEVRVGDRLFTRYTTQGGPNKPFFFPILLGDGISMTRRWPMEEVAGETRDHPHHRGLWFTHGSVNGVDYWSEGNKTGKTVHTAFSERINGPVYGGFTAATEWRAPDGALVATDTRRIRIYALPDEARLLDFEIVVKPNGAPLIFGDTKEGMFGLRVPDALAPIRKEGGRMENAEGIQDKAVWGKPSRWVDNWGTLNGQVWGVAIFDHPANLRHPQTWHARDYGLFTVNPFGLHDFGLGEKGIGDHTVPVNETLTLRYRVLFHKGTTAEARVAEKYAAYAEPPTVAVRWP